MPMPPTSRLTPASALSMPRHHAGGAGHGVGDLRQCRARRNCLSLIETDAACLAHDVLDLGRHAFGGNAVACRDIDRADVAIAGDAPLKSGNAG